MIATDHEVFKDRLNELADVFDKRRPNEHALKVWLHTLKEFPLADVCDALSGWAKIGSKMPAPGDIWKRLNDMRAERIEENAKAEKVRFEAEANRTFQRSDVVAVKLKALLRSMTASDRDVRDPKRWARRMIDDYISRSRELNGMQIRFAREALGISQEQLTEMRAEQDAIKAGHEPAFAE